MPSEIRSLPALTISTRKVRSKEQSIQEPLDEVVSVGGDGDGDGATEIRTKGVEGSNGGDSGVGGY